MFNCYRCMFCRKFVWARPICNACKDKVLTYARLKQLATGAADLEQVVKKETVETYTPPKRIVRLED